MNDKTNTKGFPMLGAIGIGAASSLAGAISTGRQNKKSRQFQEKMFDKTNKYNAPISQMERLQQAGLNPNLVYGGSSGQTAGTATQPAKPDFNTPDYGQIGEQTMQGSMNYINSKNIQSGTEVNEERAEQIRQDTINAGLEQVNKTINNSKQALDYKTKKRLFTNTVKMAEERLNNLSVDTGYKSGKNAREERVTDETVKKIRSDIQNNKKRGKILSQEAVIKKLDRYLYEDYGIRPDDPFYSKFIARILQSLGIDAKQEFQKLKL